MSDTLIGTGQCLCGKVTLKASTINPKMGACHCHMCRKWTGGPFLAIDCGSEVSWEGQEYLSIYNSSEWAERGFCRNCGSHLFYRLKEANQYFVLAGIFSEQPFVFDHQIFIEEKPDYYTFADETENLTGEEVAAKFASPLISE